jgi:peptide/nickel transport system substrate-binding protein
MRRRGILLGLFMVLALIAAACGGSSDDGADPGGGGSDTDAVAIEGGSATIISPEARSLDPSLIINTSTQGSNLMNAIYDVLFTVDPETNAIQPRIATDMTSEDGLTWTLTLKEGITFSDGTPFDAEAVRFNWQRSIDNLRATSNAQAQQIASMEVTSPTTLVLTLKEVNRQWFQNVPVNAFGWIASPASITAAGENFGNDANVIGAGPFTVESRTANVETVLVKNPTYWQPGLPKLDQLTMKPIPDQQQATDSVVTGASEAFLYPSEQLVAQAEDAGMNSIGWEENQGGVSMNFNQTKPPFDNKKAREAVSKAVDVQQMIDVVAMGYQEKITSMFRETSPFYNPEYTFPEPDAEEAQRLFDELAEETGGPLVFDMSVSTSSENAARVTQIQTQLAQFDNVEMGIRQVDAAAYGISLYTGDFEASFYAVSSPDPVPTFDQFSSTYPVPIGRLNSPQADQAIADGKSATDEAGRKAAYDSLQQVLVEDYPQLWMYRNVTWAIYQPSVTGLEAYGQGSFLVENFGFVG